MRGNPLWESRGKERLGEPSDPAQPWPSRREKGMERGRVWWKHLQQLAVVRKVWQGCWKASSQSLLSEESWVSQEGPTLVFQLWSVCPGAVVGGAASVQMRPWAPAHGSWRHWPGPPPGVGPQRGADCLHGTFRSSTTILASHLQCKTTTLFLPIWNQLMFPNTQRTLPLQQHVSCWAFLYCFVLFSLPRMYSLSSLNVF